MKPILTLLTTSPSWCSKPTPVFGPHGAVGDEDGDIANGALKRLAQQELSRVVVHPLELAVGRTAGTRPMRLLANALYRSRAATSNTG
ncbi:MAG: hypothetical protein WBE58_22900 [Verrucomicrobiales bacterium]